MADQTQEEYQNVNFYAKNTTPKTAGFSKFQVREAFYFCRYADGKIVWLSQAYTASPGRDNGIASVKKNEKLAKRYIFTRRGKTGHGFSLKAGNGQEVAISPNYKSLADAQAAASRLSGAKFSSTAKSTLTKTKATKTKATKTKTAAPKKAATKKTSFTVKDNRIENYKPLSFYVRENAVVEGFNSFEEDGAHYFNYVKNGKVVLISESYTSRAGRDNGISSVSKNMSRTDAYQHHTHKNGKHYFDINAANGQEVATSRWYSSKAAAERGATNLRDETETATSSNDEDNYQPLAFYRKHSTSKKKGFDKFQGSDGEYYFTYFENSKLALISEGYPTAAIRDKGLASVEKNMKIEKRYVQGKGADGKPGFILKAGNHKEIARSVSYASAAAAVTGAGYLLGTRRRPAAKAAAPKKTKQVKAKSVTKPKATSPAEPKPKPESKAPLAASPAVVSGAAAKTASAKTPDQDAGAIPIKAAAVVAAPVAAVAAAAAAVVPKPEPKVEPKAEPVAAAPLVAPAEVAAGGSGIWGWLKWLLLALLALLALFFLFKACVGGEKEVATAAPVISEAAAPAAMVSCWDGSKAKDNAACPAKVTCWDGSFKTTESACPVQPPAKTYDCWDGSKAVDLAACPAQPVAKAAAPKMTAAEPTKMTAPSVTGRLCGPSSSVLFNVTNSTPVNVTYLGSNPQFGNSQNYSSDEFFRRLEVKYRTSPRDKGFLDLLARSLGYGSFQNMDASMFSEDRLEQGTSGVLGLGTQHALQFSTLNVTDPTHLEAFKVKSTNGTDVHFMKQCGNFMYVCQP